jgi:hypothetical protein
MRHEQSEREKESGSEIRRNPHDHLLAHRSCPACAKGGLKAYSKKNGREIRAEPTERMITKHTRRSE